MSLIKRLFGIFKKEPLTEKDLIAFCKNELRKAGVDNPIELKEACRLFDGLHGLLPDHSGFADAMRKGKIFEFTYMKSPSEEEMWFVDFDVFESDFIQKRMMLEIEWNLNKQRD